MNSRRYQRKNNPAAALYRKWMDMLLHKKDNNFIRVSYFDVDYLAKVTMRDALEECARRYAAGALLDVGCGKKPYRELFLPHVESYTGLDSPEFKTAHYGEHTSADIWADCTDTKLNASSYDTVLCTQVLEHVASPGLLLKEAYRLLRRKGYLIITVPMVSQLHAVPHDYYRFTQFGLSSLLEEQGFHVIQSRAMGKTSAALTWLCLNCRQGKTKISRALHRLCVLPFINLKAAYDDRHDSNENLCISCLAVAQRP